MKEDKDTVRQRYLLISYFINIIIKNIRVNFKLNLNLKDFYLTFIFYNHCKFVFFAMFIKSIN